MDFFSYEAVLRKFDGFLRQPRLYIVDFTWTLDSFHELNKRIFFLKINSYYIYIRLQ